MRYYGHLESMDDWEQLLTDPDMQWVDNCSAKELARTWAHCRRFPEKVHGMFEAASMDLVPLFGFPQFRIILPGGNHPSHNDLYILARYGSGDLFPIMVEGKGNESFGPLVRDWKRDRSGNELERLDFLARELELRGKEIDPLRYQFLQRTVTVLLEGSRVGAEGGMLLVHVFGENGEFFEDYSRFLSIFDLGAEKDVVQGPINLNGFSLYFGWVQEPPS